MIVESLGGVVQPYDLQVDQGWQIDLAHLEAAITPKTRAIVVNNPSNPTGAVLPRVNLEGLLAVAARHRLPVIADEIYGNMVFSGHALHPLGALTTAVPVLTVGACSSSGSSSSFVHACTLPHTPRVNPTPHPPPFITTGGLAKQFAVPGWRVGWILLHDPRKLLSAAPNNKANGGVSAKQGIKNLTQIIIGANTLCQAVIPTLFPPKQLPSPSPSAPDPAPRSRSGSTTSTEEDDEASVLTPTGTTPTTTPSPHEALAAFHRRYVGTLEGNARFLVEAIAADERFAGRVAAEMPQGAMYAMLRLAPGGLRGGLGDDDVAFCALLLQEENVVLLPGQAFGVRGYVRVVVAAPREMLGQAVARLAAFVERHAA